MSSAMSIRAWISSMRSSGINGMALRFRRAPRGRLRATSPAFGSEGRNRDGAAALGAREAVGHPLHARAGDFQQTGSEHGLLLNAGGQERQPAGHEHDEQEPRPPHPPD